MRPRRTSRANKQLGGDAAATGKRPEAQTAAQREFEKKRPAPQIGIRHKQRDVAAFFKRHPLPAAEEGQQTKQRRVSGRPAGRRFFVAPNDANPA